ncbi:MAG: MarR family transcriptional regulator [Proteobacteria bacterium]|nr:MarR family transcriptional regulator [Pseudomonadota bacterium]
MTNVDSVSALQSRQPSLPGLLRAARATYGRAIRTALEHAGFADIPGNGLHVIAAVARAEQAMAHLITTLTMSKQATGQLVDVLVARGYVERVADPGDRRRLRVQASARGRAAAAVIGAAVATVDAELARRLPANVIEHARTMLLELARMRAEPSGSTNEESV